MQSLEHRRYYSSFVLLYKCMNSNGPQYIKNFFQTRYTKHNLKWYYDQKKILFFFGFQNYVN